MRVLVMTKIFPNSVEPWSSPFNRQQFAQLGALCDLEVLATIPWFPGARAFRRWSAAGRLTEVPSREVIDGLEVAHPRFLFFPKFGAAATGALYTASLLPALFRRRGGFDVVLGSWAYPDGYAAVALGRIFSRPSVVKLHGSDINGLASRPGLSRRVGRALAGADRVIAVSRALADEAVRIGARAERVEVVMNGVDASLFFPSEKERARTELGLGDGRWIVYVGRLEREKGVLDLLEAFEALAARRPELRLLLVGDGALRGECEARARRAGGAVRVVGARPLSEVPRYLAAADVLTLPSWNEGTPNVILEALACGRPVVATRVGGIPELVSAPVLGELVPPRAPAELGAALERVADGVGEGRHPAEAIAAVGGRAGWRESAARVRDLLARTVEEHAAGARR